MNAHKSGIMSDIFLYSGSYITVKSTCSVVMKLLGILNRAENYKLYIDNWFYILELLLQLKETNKLSTPSICMDRFKICPLFSEKDLK